MDCLILYILDNIRIDFRRNTKPKPTQSKSINIQQSNQSIQTTESINPIYTHNIKNEKRQSIVLNEILKLENIFGRNMKVCTRPSEVQVIIYIKKKKEISLNHYKTIQV